MSTNPRSMVQRQTATRFPTNGVPYPGVAAGTASEVPIYVDDRSNYSTGGSVVASAAYVPNATITGVNTNYVTLNIRRYNSAGTLQGTVATISFQSGTNATAFASAALGSLANTTLAPGDTLTLQVVHSGTGMIVPPGMVVVDLNRP